MYLIGVRSVHCLQTKFCWRCNYLSQEQPILLQEWFLGNFFHKMWRLWRVHYRRFVVVGSLISFFFLSITLTQTQSKRCCNILGKTNSAEAHRGELSCWMFGLWNLSETSNRRRVCLEKREIVLQNLRTRSQLTKIKQQTNKWMYLFCFVFPTSQKNESTLK